MNLNRLLNNIHFSDKLLSKFENVKKTQAELAQLIIINKLDPNSHTFFDALLAIDSLIKFDSFAFDGDTLVHNRVSGRSKINRKVDIVDYLSGFKNKELESACIIKCAEFSLLLKYSEYSDFANSLYDNNHQVKPMDEVIKIWLSERPEDSKIIEEYNLTGCLDNFYHHVKKLESLYELKNFEDFVTKE